MFANNKQPMWADKDIGNNLCCLWLKHFYYAINDYLFRLHYRTMQQA